MMQCVECDEINGQLLMHSSEAYLIIGERSCLLLCCARCSRAPHYDQACIKPPVGLGPYFWHFGAL